jgi:hypothetical protein
MEDLFFPQNISLSGTLLNEHSLFKSSDSLSLHIGHKEKYFKQKQIV